MSSSPVSGNTMSVPVKLEDTLSEIAADNHMSLKELLALNPQFDASKVDGRLDPNRSGELGYDPDFIRPGDTIILPKQVKPNGGNGSGTSATPVNSTQDSPSGSSKGPIDLNDVYNRYKGGDYKMNAGRKNGYGIPGEKVSDCSAFVSAVWAEKGVPLRAHTDEAYEQLKGMGAKTVTNNPQPGDIVFWMGEGTGGHISHHMGIYMGDGKVLQQTGRNGGGVQIFDIPKSGIEILRDPRMQ